MFTNLAVVANATLMPLSFANFNVDSKSLLITTDDAYVKFDKAEF